MSFIELSNKHQVGVKMIDDQHSKFADMINYLDDALNSGADIKEVLILLNAIIGFAEYHFDEEENYLLRVEHPDYKEHAGKHNELRNRLEEAKNDLEKDNAKLPNSLAKFLKEWLINHIEVLGPDLNKKGSKITV